jgi:signal transduction histidine kinase
MIVKKLRGTKITWKLTLVYASIFSLVLILLNASVLYGVKFFLINQAVHKLETTDQMITEILENTSHTTSQQLTTLEDVHIDASINVKVYSSEKSLIFIANNFQVPFYPFDSHFQRINKIETDTDHFVITNRLCTNKDKEITYLQLYANLEHEYAFLKILFVFLAVADLIGVGSSLFIGYLISKNMLYPIDKITKAAQSISINNLNSRIAVRDVDDELSRLGSTFNEMINRLQLSFEKQNQFVSDASHELRTPIAIIQGYINLIDRWGKDDKSVLQESIDAIKSETMQMNHLIEKLLLIARGENGNLVIEKEYFSLNSLLMEIVTESKIIDTTHHITYELSEEIQIYADRNLFKQMLRALMDNSIKFTQEQGYISLSCIQTDTHIELSVTDTGIGIAGEELHRIFDRFYQVDKTRGQYAGGSGLGLPIVKLIANAHGGQILAQSLLNEGTKVTLAFPRQQF